MMESQAAREWPAETEADRRRLTDSFASLGMMVNQWAGGPDDLCFAVRSAVIEARRMIDGFDANLFANRHTHCRNKQRQIKDHRTQRQKNCHRSHTNTNEDGPDGRKEKDHRSEADDGEAHDSEADDSGAHDSEADDGEAL